jgi:hypothetical protein
MDYNIYNNNLTKCIKYVDSMEKNIIGSGKDGIVYKLESSCSSFILKVYNNNTSDEKNRVYREINILDRVKYLIDKKISPHFIYFYDFLKNKKNNISIIMHYADGNLNDWLNITHSKSEWKSFIFQILIAIYTMQKYLKGYHSQLYPKNIYYIKIPKDNTYFQYNIDNNIYYLKNTGYLFIIANFGNFQSTFFDNNNVTDIELNHAIRHNHDFNYIKNIFINIQVNYLIKKYTITSLTNKFKNNINYMNYLKNNNDLYDLIFYCLQNNLFSKKNLNKDILPNKKIIKLFNDVFNSSHKITDILYQYFSKYTQNKKNIIDVYNLNLSL